MSNKNKPEHAAPKQDATVKVTATIPPEAADFAELATQAAEGAELAKAAHESLTAADSTTVPTGGFAVSVLGHPNRSYPGLATSADALAAYFKDEGIVETRNEIKITPLS